MLIDMNNTRIIAYRKVTKMTPTDRKRNNIANKLDPIIL